MDDPSSGSNIFLTYRFYSVGSWPSEHRVLLERLHAVRWPHRQARLQLLVERGRRQVQSAALHLHVELRQRIFVDSKYFNFFVQIFFTCLLLNSCLMILSIDEWLKSKFPNVLSKLFPIVKQEFV